MARTNAGRIKFAFANITSATTTALVAAVTGASIVVIGLFFTLAGTTPTIKFQGGSTDISPTFDTIGIYPLGDFTDRAVPVMSTAQGEALNVVTGGTPTVRVMVAYYENTAE